MNILDDEKRGYDYRMIKVLSADANN